MDDLTDILIAESIINSVSKMGLEGTLEAIPRVYSQNPTLRDKMLKIFKKLYKL